MNLDFFPRSKPISHLEIAIFEMLFGNTKIYLYKRSLRKMPEMNELAREQHLLQSFEISDGEITEIRSLRSIDLKAIFYPFIGKGSFSGPPKRLAGSKMEN